MAAAGALALTTAHGMIVRIHRNTTNLGTIALPAVAACLAELLALMLIVADLADAGATPAMKLAHLAGRKLHKNIIAFLRHQLGRNSGAAHQLRAFADLHLDIVDDAAKGHVAHGKTVARLDINSIAGDDFVTDANTKRGKNITLLPVNIVQKSDVGGAVRVILNRGNLRRDINLLPLEVDKTVFALMSTANMPRGHTAIIVAATTFFQRLHQRLLRLILGQLGINNGYEFSSSR